MTTESDTYLGVMSCTIYAMESSAQVEMRFLLRTSCVKKSLKFFTLENFVFDAVRPTTARYAQRTVNSFNSLRIKTTDHNKPDVKKL